MQFSSPMDFDEIPSGTLARLLAKLSRQKIGGEKAELLKNAARDSFGVTFAQDSFTFQLKALLSQISFIEDQINDTDAEIASIMEKLDSPVTTITGIGKVTGAAIISEIGGISRKMCNIIYAVLKSGQPYVPKA